MASTDDTPAPLAGGPDHALAAATLPVTIDRAAERAQAEQTASNARADSTKRAYDSDWRWFAAWCARRGDIAFPAEPETVAVYIDQAARVVDEHGRYGYQPATLTRWVASINARHRAAGLTPPGNDPQVRDVLRGIRRGRRTPQTKKAPILLDPLRAVIADLRAVTAWPDAVAARRDAALLLTGFASANRRSELAQLLDTDVTLHTYDGLRLLLRSSKTDRQAQGTVKAIPYGTDPVTCAPCAWLLWRLVATAPDRAALMAVSMRAPGGHMCRSIDLPEPTGAPAFVAVDRHGRLSPRALSGQAIASVVKRRFAGRGIDPADLGGHSLRSGFVTQSFRSGADLHAVAKQTGHRSFTVLAGYARDADPLAGNAVTQVGL